MYPVRKLIYCAVILATSNLQANTPSYLQSSDVENLLPTAELPVGEMRPSVAETQLPQVRNVRLPLSTQFDLRGLEIEGGSVYPFEQISQRFAPLVNRRITLRDLLLVTESITQDYQRDGYVLSYAYVPEQNLIDGVVRVVIVEGYVQSHEMKGEVGLVEEHVRRLGEQLLNERPLKRETFERYTTLMAQIPGVKVKAQVQPPATTDGATVLVTEATRKAFDFGSSIQFDEEENNKLLLSATANSHTPVAEQVTVSTLLSDSDDNEEYVRLDYNQFIGADGLRLSGFASGYRNSEGQISSQGTVSTRENTRLSLGLTYPLILSSRESLTAGVRLYGVNDERNFTLIRRNPAQVFVDGLTIDSKIRVLGFESDWRTLDAKGQLRILSAGLYQGIDGLGARSEARFLGQNIGAQHDLDFTRLRLSAVQNLNLADNWQLALSGAAYWSDDVLPQTEQVLFGGRNFARGYPSEQAYGDSGIGLGYELSYRFDTDYAHLKLVQPYVAMDWARTYLNGSTGEEAKLSSAALGVRFGDRRHYNLALEVAKPLGDEAVDTGNKEPRVGLILNYSL